MRINEDFIDKLDDESIISISDSDSNNLKPASFDSGFRYSVTLTLAGYYYLGFIANEGTRDYIDPRQFYLKYSTRIYKFLNRINRQVSDFSEIVFTSDSLTRGYTISQQDINELKKEIKDGFSLKREYVKLTFFMNAHFSTFSLIQFLAGIGRAATSACAYMTIVDGDNHNMFSFQSFIPLVSSFGRDAETQDYWFGKRPNSLGERTDDNGARARQDLLTFVYSMMDISIKNYEIVKEVIGFDYGRHLFEYVQNSLCAGRPKKVALKNSVTQTLDEAKIKIDDFFGEDNIGMIYQWDTTSDRLSSISSNESRETYYRSVLNSNFKDRVAPVIFYDIFMHNVVQSYSRNVTGIFYIGPVEYRRDCEGAFAVYETFLVLDRYDARDAKFWHTLNRILEKPLNEKDTAWCIKKFHDTK